MLGTKNAVGTHITFQLVGDTGPVPLGTFTSFDIKPNPVLNRRMTNDGQTESEAVSMGHWNISLERGKKGLTIERLIDRASDQATVPSLQAVYMIQDPNTGELGQWLLTGIKFTGHGTTVKAGVVDETVEFEADKRTPVA